MIDSYGDPFNLPLPEDRVGISKFRPNIHLRCTSVKSLIPEMLGLPEVNMQEEQRISFIVSFVLKLKELTEIDYGQCSQPSRADARALAGNSLVRPGQGG